MKTDGVFLRIFLFIFLVTICGMQNLYPTDASPLMKGRIELGLNRFLFSPHYITTSTGIGYEYIDGVRRTVFFENDNNFKLSELITTGWRLKIIGLSPYVDSVSHRISITPLKFIDISLTNSFTNYARYDMLLFDTYWSIALKVPVKNVSITGFNAGFCHRVTDYDIYGNGTVYGTDYKWDHIFVYEITQTFNIADKDAITIRIGNRRDGLPVSTGYFEVSFENVYMVNKYAGLYCIIAHSFAGAGSLAGYHDGLRWSIGVVCRIL